MHRMLALGLGSILEEKHVDAVVKNFLSDFANDELGPEEEGLRTGGQQLGGILRIDVSIWRQV